MQIQYCIECKMSIIIQTTIIWTTKKEKNVAYYKMHLKFRDVKMCKNISLGGNEM